MKGRYRDVVIPAILVLMLIITGIFGYMYITRLRFLDALYMTVITISTVGYREMFEISDAGKIFTIFMILTSVAIMAYTITSLTKLVVEGYFKKKIKDYNVRKKIIKLSNHVIVCGYGRNGFQACEELADHDIEFVIIEKRENVVERIRENPALLFIQGDAASEDVLQQAQISKARALITALPNDADNIYVVLTAREMNKNIKIITRASEFKSDLKLRRAGADNVIMPDRIGGQRMAKLVAQEDVVEFLEYVMLQRMKDVSLEKISLRNLKPDMENKTIAILKLRDHTGVNIVGMRHDTGGYVFNPEPDTILTSQENLFVLGTRNQIETLKSFLLDE